MKPTTSVSTATASGGVVGALVVVLVWVASLFHIVVPAEVAAAGMVCLTPILHIIAVRLSGPPAAKDAKLNDAG